MHSREFIKRLENEGFELVRVKESHHQFKHANSDKLITVPHPKKDLPTGTLIKMMKDAGLK